LASRAELIAHHRSSEQIAKVIGADAVIYQTLDDLKAACAELSPRPSQQFEVGVFCGEYCTPVSDNYFAHLDALRGTRKKEKDVEMATLAVAQAVGGGVTAEAIMSAIPTNGAVGNGVPAIATKDTPQAEVDGNVADDEDVSVPVPAPQKQQQPSATQDISLHNLNDYQDSA
jgi:amidophosphoribosyltransferase